MSLGYDYIEVSEYLMRGCRCESGKYQWSTHRKGMDGDKWLAVVYLGEAQVTADLLATFQMCSNSVEDLDKDRFVFVGCRQKGTLGAEVRTPEVQEKFKALMIQL